MAITEVQIDELTIPIREDGTCTCMNSSHPCPLRRTGAELRCTVAELEAVTNPVLQGIHHYLSTNLDSQWGIQWGPWPTRKRPRELYVTKTRLLPSHEIEIEVYNIELTDGDASITAISNRINVVDREDESFQTFELNAPDSLQAILMHLKSR